TMSCATDESECVTWTLSAGCLLPVRLVNVRVRLYITAYAQRGSVVLMNEPENAFHIVLASGKFGVPLVILITRKSCRLITFPSVVDGAAAVAGSMLIVADDETANGGRSGAAAPVWTARSVGTNSLPVQYAAFPAGKGLNVNV